MDDLTYLNQPVDSLISQAVATQPYPRPEEDEVALRALGTNAGLHLRSDGVVDLFADPGHIVLDPATVSLIAEVKRFLGLCQQFDLVGLNRFSINGMDLNPSWLGEVDLVSNIALIPIDLDSLKRVFVHVSPDPTIPAVPITKFITTQPLFLDPRPLSDLLGPLGPLIQHLP